MLRLLRRSGRPRRLVQLGWLIFLGFQVLTFFATSHSPGEWLLFWGTLGVFVTLYVAYYWREDGGERHDTQWALAAFWSTLTAAIVLGGVVGASATGLLIYGAFMVGYQPRLRLALGLVLGAYVLPLLGAVLWTREQWSGQEWGPGVVLGVTTLCAYLLFGAYSAHQEWRGRWAMRQLRAAQAEKERVAADAERERIARDLHDLLGHTLSVIVLKSELAARLTDQAPDRAAAEIREVERISREALGEVRAAVQGYRGSGFSAELARAKVALDTAGIRLNITAPLPELPEPLQSTLAMVLREAVTNVVRHSGATELRLTLESGSGGYRLMLHDDGSGELAPDGTGLSSMRERLRAMGGSLERTGGSGTRLVAWVPLEGHGGPGLDSGGVAYP